MTSVKTNKKGFTLVELVVVIAILAILAAIAIPVVNSIINTASKNGALSNAQTIELAIKEAQADIASKNTETYAEAKSESSKITVKLVAETKAITDAFEKITYNSEEYYPIWVKAEQKVYFITDDGTTKGKRLDDPAKTVADSDKTVLVKYPTTGTAIETTPINSLSQKSTTSGGSDT
jgi:prepilin-type N-terminal cleavage/methylation domain-containing protein